MQTKPLYTFGGGEGAGKGTQIPLAVEWMKSLGLQVRVSREPGGSDDGERIRNLLMFTAEQAVFLDRKPAICMYLDLLVEHVQKSGDEWRYLVPLIQELKGCSEFSRHLEMALFVVSRLIHLKEVILPFLAGHTSDDALILDRFFQCTYAYQVVTRCATSRDDTLTLFVRGLYEWHIEYMQGLRIFPMILILDIDPEIGLNRISNRGGEKTVIDAEKLPFHQMVRRAYQRFVEKSHPAHSVPQWRNRCILIDGNPSIEEVFASVQEAMLPGIQHLVLRSVV